ncbi:hypothetical protein CYMTET_51732 [Cymbomonas tetramitiformis]|uniref:Uncharacterized protein n=1 Tax=Cymbomonas tetramitiformis TaxID=36881 RepID=A0AAE0BLL5_9CHLO|nr:hypothetical protein CYMTET_51732 [Cymbomonas tetramitiformis]
MDNSWDFFGDSFGDCKPSELPALPDGRQLLIQTGNFAECNVSALVWTGAISLCRWMLSAADEIRGKAVLELGTGTGACGLYAAALGARRVTLTDGGSPAGFSSLATASLNAEANRELWSTETEVAVTPYTWGEPFGAELGGYNLVIGSDLTAYSKEAHLALCSSLAEQLRKHSGGCRVVMSHYHRTHGIHAALPSGGDESLRDGTFENFIARAAEAGLTVRTFQEDWPSLLRLAASKNGDRSQICKPSYQTALENQQMRSGTC